MRIIQRATSHCMMLLKRAFLNVVKLFNINEEASDTLPMHIQEQFQLFSIVIYYKTSNLIDTHYVV